MVLSLGGVGQRQSRFDLLVVPEDSGCITFMRAHSRPNKDKEHIKRVYLERMEEAQWSVIWSKSSLLSTSGACAVWPLFATVWEM